MLYSRCHEIWGQVDTHVAYRLLKLNLSQASVELVKLVDLTDEEVAVPTRNL
jgi:hypothetical protein